MADVSFTAGDLAIAADTSYASVTAGETLNEWDPVYLNGTAYDKADNTTQAKSAVVGIVVVGATATGKAVIATGGSLFHATSIFSKSTNLWLSDVGGWYPDADKTAGDWVTQLGFQKSATEFVIDRATRAIQV